MPDYELARPNEAKVIEYLDLFEVNEDDWRSVALSLLGYLSDDDVREWTRYFGIEDYIFDKEDEDDE